MYPKSTITSSNNNKKDFTKTRLSSIAPMSLACSTSIGASKQADPRQINDLKVKEEFSIKIISYLFSEAYEIKVPNHRNLQSLSTKEIYSIITFIYKKLRPDFTEIVSEENIFQILLELKYPGHITKNHFAVVGAPGSINHILALLAWLVELAEYLREFIHSDLNLNSLITESPTANNKIMTNTRRKDCLNDKEINDYINRCFKSPMNAEEERNSLIAKGHSIVQDNINIKNEIDRKCSSITTQINKLKESENSLKDATLLHTNYIDILKESKKKGEAIALQTESISKANDKKKKQIEAIDKKNLALQKEMEATERLIKEQRVSFDQYNKIVEKKQTLFDSYDITALRLIEVNERYNQAKKRVIDKRKQILLLQNSLNTDKYSLKSIDIEKYLLLCGKEGIDYEKDIRALILKDHECLVQLFNQFQSEFKEKKMIASNLDVEIWKLDDKEKELTNILNQTENEQKAKLAEINGAKEKSNSFQEAYNEEVKQINLRMEEYKKTENKLRIKKEALFIEEQNAIKVFQENEQDCMDFIKELENEYNQTISEMQKMKNYNLQKLKENSKILAFQFNNFKKDLESIIK